MYNQPLTTEQVLSRLAAEPGTIANLTMDLIPAQLLIPPEPGEWSARDVLAHLRACSDIWGRAIVAILSQNHPTFKAINPTNWIRQTDYLTQEFQPSLQAFTRQRAELLDGLQPLGPDGWSRSATVTGAGKPIERGVYTYAQWLANQEKTHFKQIERTANAVRVMH